VRDGDGCKKENKAKNNFVHVNELGLVSAMFILGRLLADLDPQRWRWWGRAAALGNCSSFLNVFAEQDSSVVQFWLWKCNCHVCNRTSIARVRE
jgi:hypothetical protein